MANEDIIENQRAGRSHTNRLITQQSPYLLQHAHNPVDWYPWGDEPFERAKNENKPVLVSIGYAACHWCHVMERESFEKEAVAAYMNEHFINIKVDREEHPDVDHLYMDAIQAISGSGGWPLNAFVTPDRVPFYGGTYFPPSAAYNRPSWLQMLQRIHQIWTEQQDEIRLQTDQMLQHLRQASQVALADKDTSWNMDSCRKMAETLLHMADHKEGGFGKAPKFPGTMAISFLLEHHHFTKHPDSLDHALLSLDKMSRGGIYDQLGGGFSRYSTDTEWLAPHFEKMLYDNALLIISLSDAYQLTKQPRFRQTIEETIRFIDLELKHPSGIYYSALDADSEGVEGKFYTWTWEDWINIVGEDDKISAAHFGVIPEGNWEHTNILHIARPISDLSKETGITEAAIEERIRTAKQKLLAQRGTRIRPLTDDKSLLSWNALMNQALSAAGVALADEACLQTATSHMSSLLATFYKDGALMHVWKNGVARIAANLDDYAYLIQALLRLASATGDPSWILKANELNQIVLKEFSDESGSFFYYTSVDQTDIPVRKIDLYDGATPSANAVMAHNLLVLGLCTEQHEYLERSYFMLQQMLGHSLRYTYSFSCWSSLLQRYTAVPKTIICSGDSALNLCKQLQEHYTPEAYIFTSQKEIFNIPILRDKFFTGESLIFVCTQQACLKPVSSVEETLHLISAYSK